QPQYIHTPTGTTAHPDTILQSCHALQTHIHDLSLSARATLAAFEQRRWAAELAEKRRVAPGWLDGEVRILRPENIDGDGEMEGVVEGEDGMGLVERRDGVPDAREGEALDRAFGGMNIT
ncbi:hypothetical protein P280DRAFT_386575, partial [Massarina eburnea CBS 473.64]